MGCFMPLGRIADKSNQYYSTEVQEGQKRKVAKTHTTRPWPLPQNSISAAAAPSAPRQPQELVIEHPQVPYEMALTQDEEDQFLKIVDRIGEKITPEEMSPFIALLEQDSPAPELIQHAKT